MGVRLTTLSRMDALNCWLTLLTNRPAPHLVNGEGGDGEGESEGEW